MKNKRKTKGWSAERRAAYAAHIRETRPWEKSTGPATKNGKNASSRNALKHGFRTGQMAEIRKLLRAQHAFVRAVIARHTGKNMIDSKEGE